MPALLNKPAATDLVPRYRITWKLSTDSLPSQHTAAQLYTAHMPVARHVGGPKCLAIFPPREAEHISYLLISHNGKFSIQTRAARANASHGSHLLAAGMEITVVSERLGHSSVRVTADVYSHAIRGRDDEAARRWEEFQGAEFAGEAHRGSVDSSCQLRLFIAALSCRNMSEQLPTCALPCYEQTRGGLSWLKVNLRSVRIRAATARHRMKVDIAARTVRVRRECRQSNAIVGIRSAPQRRAKNCAWLLAQFWG
jgi:hypothetical protein